MIEVSIIIPCFNEEKSIYKTITEIKSWAIQNRVSIEVIVGDNNSTDNSHAFATEAGAKVISVYKRGYGNVIIETSRYAVGEFLIFLDADGQHRIGDIEQIYNKLKTGIDLVIGNRFHSKKRTYSTSFIKEYIGNPFLTNIGKFLFNSKINDFHSGFRGVKHTVFDSLNMVYPGFELCSELIAKAEAAKYTVRQVPIEVSKPFLNRRSNIRPIIDGFKHINCLLNTAYTYKKYGRLFVFLLIFNILLLLPFFLFKNMVITSDTNTYNDWSNLLIQNGIKGILRNNSYFFSKIFYLFHLLYLCFLKFFLGTHWMTGHYICNLIVHLFTGLLIYLNSYRLTKNSGFALLSNILFYCAIEYSMITFCLLSDTNFIFLINLLFTLYLFRKKFARYFLSFFILLLAIIVLYRPTGINILFTVLFFYVIYFFNKNINRKKIIVRSLLFIFIFLLIGNVYVLYQGLDYIKLIPIHFLQSKFQFDSKGIVVWDRYFVDSDFHHNIFSSINFYLEKFIRFFQFIVLGFSRIHLIFNMLFFIPTYWALTYVLTKKFLFSMEVSLIIFFVFFTAFFHTFTVIDYDWRYRLVFIPFLCNLFAISLNSIFKKNEQ